MNVLIADDEEYMLNILKVYFNKEGFNVFLANDGEEALNILYKNNIDLAVLDWMMPKVDGVNVCKEIKKNMYTKVIMLTAKSQNEDELMVLQVGADDYIRKPFDPRIVIMRSKKLLSSEKVVIIEDLKIDFQGKQVYKKEENLNLTKTEFGLIKCFYNNKGQILSRQKLLDVVWGIDYLGDDRTVDTHINRLRDKIGEKYIKTHRGMGYSFEA